MSEPRVPRWILLLIVLAALLLGAIGIAFVFFPKAGNFAATTNAVLTVAVGVVAPLLAIALVLWLRPAAWTYGALGMLAFHGASLLLLLMLLTRATEPADWLFDEGAVVTAAIVACLVLLGWSVKRAMRAGPRTLAPAVAGAAGMLLWPAVAGAIGYVLLDGIIGSKVMAGFPLLYA